MEQAFQYCQACVRGADKDRFLTSLFAPAQHRGALFALYAFNVELAQVRDRISSPLPGEVRLQYWHDLLSGTTHGDASANPVAAALHDTVERYALPVSALLALIEARRFDVYDEPMRSMAALERYALATSASVIRLAATILDNGREPDADEPIRHAGIAAGLARVLQGLPQHAARGQCYLPSDLLGRHGVLLHDMLAGRDGEGLRSALAELRQSVRHHLAAARTGIHATSAALLPALLPLAVVPLMLQRMESPGYSPFRPLVVPQWRRQWTLWQAAKRPSRITG